jgi:hypothetical protein
MYIRVGGLFEKSQKSGPNRGPNYDPVEKDTPTLTTIPRAATTEVDETPPIKATMQKAKLRGPKSTHNLDVLGVRHLRDRLLRPRYTP